MQEARSTSRPSQASGPVYRMGERRPTTRGLGRKVHAGRDGWRVPRRGVVVHAGARRKCHDRYPFPWTVLKFVTGTAMNDRRL